MIFSFQDNMGNQTWVINMTFYILILISGLPHVISRKRAPEDFPHNPNARNGL